ncbi:SDR family oxidoreductase [cf. Phormidesmis sp. LEGE 11477]|uniref:SDR family oxidoreductase n=1 Tax=cf. Phormidesmis sp. LEGE 11477 TaxID=1828680 RepID=UPI0018821384|nr:SDR family oxidoreductase [cf. Phormidesmis sp. LEGE 11477]MBE9061560.1 SDR family oxidoreductase [cf. Phormidesmis sp. LEGE 11477]
MPASRKIPPSDHSDGHSLGSALITGASSGIGEATARAFAQAGFDLLLMARSKGKLFTLAEELGALGVKAEGVAVDLANCEKVNASVEAAIARFGPVDILVNSAGMGYTGPIGDMPLADWQRVMALNVTSVFQMVQSVLPGMRSRSRGLIINIASIAAQQAFPNWGAYGVSKAALVQLSKAIAAEESTNGIRVVTLSSGAVNTPLWDTNTVQANFDRSAMLAPETVAQTILQTALLPANAVISHLTITPSVGAL